ncbi:unnamed protein product [Rhizophagus irregularis]|nr:unnamed protein product [Rhizophagus irregularis]
MQLLPECSNASFGKARTSLRSRQFLVKREKGKGESSKIAGESACNHYHSGDRTNSTILPDQQTPASRKDSMMMTTKKRQNVPELIRARLIIQTLKEIIFSC